VSRPRFLADEDLRFEIVLAVRRMEPAHEIATIVELHQSGLPDPDVLAYAQNNGLLHISHDVYTMQSEAMQRIADGRGIGGLFLTAQRNPSRPVAETIVTIWGATEAEEWRDRIVYIPF
jgi:hypothetical protein